MRFNLKEELTRPRGHDNALLSLPKTNELQRSSSYYEAKKKEKRTRETLRSVNGMKPTEIFSGTGLHRGPE